MIALQCLVELKILVFPFALSHVGILQLRLQLVQLLFELLLFDLKIGKQLKFVLVIQF